MPCVNLIRVPEDFQFLHSRCISSRLWSCSFPELHQRSASSSKVISNSGLIDFCCSMFLATKSLLFPLLSRQKSLSGSLLICLSVKKRNLMQMIHQRTLQEVTHPFDTLKTSNERNLGCSSCLRSCTLCPVLPRRFSLKILVTSSKGCSFSLKAKPVSRMILC